MTRKFTYAKRLKSPETIGSIVRQISQIMDAEGMRIEYRTFGPNGEDLLAGACVHVRGSLVPEDHDSYSMDDEIIRYEVAKNGSGKPELTVWYKSDWM